MDGLFYSSKYSEPCERNPGSVKLVSFTNDDIHHVTLELNTRLRLWLSSAIIFNGYVGRRQSLDGEELCAELAYSFNYLIYHY